MANSLPRLPATRELTTALVCEATNLPARVVAATHDRFLPACAADMPPAPFFGLYLIYY